MRLRGRFRVWMSLRFVSPVCLGVARSATGDLDCFLRDYIFALTLNANLIIFCMWILLFAFKFCQS